MDFNPQATVIGNDLFITFGFQDSTYSMLMPNDNLSQSVFMDVFAYKCYPLLPATEFKPRVIVDIGGFIGDSALYFHLFYPQAAVHVYEPAKKNLFYMGKNLKDFQKIQVHSYGLAGKTEEAEIYLGQGGAQNSRFLNDETTTLKEKIRLKSVQEEIEELDVPIDILKVDIEGNEPEIIAEFLKHSKNEIPIIYFEYHAEEDRLAIDQLLKDKYTLSFGDIQTQNRGTLLYVAKNFKDEAYAPYQPIATLKD